MLCCMMLPVSLTTAWTFLSYAFQDGDGPLSSNIDSVNPANFTGELIKMYRQAQIKSISTCEDIFLKIWCLWHEIYAPKSGQFILKVLFPPSFSPLSHFWCSSPCFSSKNSGGRPSWLAISSSGTEHTAMGWLSHSEGAELWWGREAEPPWWAVREEATTTASTCPPGTGRGSCSGVTSTSLSTANSGKNAIYPGASAP